ncbi:putative Glycosyl transferase family 2 protein [Candidatus Ichthyocystis hellenicum]|uniref:Putative Glycosyl transferase family 2 protein n=1 Tax=Candidatus Ichthyocystis hellenicum TaxID=1561003 RepID=A0A0S4M327_9BURK|nr:glycosyltransferase family A protein [Candidatus Ichthyocystis hellenicum]CUT18179.1 putative Glycosyl transferase family 2 protein [Candidatus Ichthyocystis hellenicum]
MTSIAVVIPVHNGGETWSHTLSSVQEQSVKVKELIVLDIESTDSTSSVAENHFAKVIPIFAKDWDPWHTRQWGASQTKESEIIVYLSQNCILESNYALEELAETLVSKNSYMVYGRQKCDRNAPTNLSNLYRDFFPAHNCTKEEIAKRLPIAMKFCIYYHAFAAYSKQKLLRLNSSLPNRIFAAEDLLIMDNLIRERKSVSYCAKAAVIRATTPSIKQYFLHSMDRGTAYSKEKNLLSFKDGGLCTTKDISCREKNYPQSREHFKEKIRGIIYRASCEIGYQMGKRRRPNTENWTTEKHGEPLIRGLV